MCAHFASRKVFSLRLGVCAWRGLFVGNRGWKGSRDNTSCGIPPPRSIKCDAGDPTTRIRPLAQPRKMAPDPPASTCALSPAILRSISTALETPLASLHTLTLTCANTSLYHAVLEYAALHPSLEHGAEKTDNLVVTTTDAFEPVDVSDEDGDEDGRTDKLTLLMKSFSLRGKGAVLCAGEGLARKQAQEVKKRMGLGCATVVWPPRKGMKAEDVRLAKEAARKRESGKQAANGAEPVPNGGGDVTAEAGNEGDADAKEECVVHIVHYSIGEPLETSRGKTVIHTEIHLATAKKNMLHTFCREVMQWRVDKDYRDGAGRKYALHRFKTDSCGDGGWWAYEGMKNARAAETVILAEGRMESILRDVANFLLPATKKWYIEHGLSQRRSYLFYGPPGTGKTSTIRVLASTFRLNCCFLSMTDGKFSNQNLCDALGEIPPNALLVLEDVDALFNVDRKSDAPSLTFSGLLNALDGVVSADGVITVLTTNHVDRLDRALIRGGRVDRRFLFAAPGSDEIVRMFQSYYAEASMEVAKRFADCILERKEGEEARAVSTLEQLFIVNRELSAEKCVDGVDEFYESHFPQGSQKEQTGLYV